jgi:hypothetical protein
VEGSWRWLLRYFLRAICVWTGLASTRPDVTARLAPCGGRAPGHITGIKMQDEGGNDEG